MSFLLIHSLDPTPSPIKWETLKCVLWGKFIQHGTKLKKERSFRISTLLNNIYDLEHHHKIHADPTIYQELTQSSEELYPLLDISNVCYQELTKRYSPEFGNKPGQMLVHSICKKQVLIYKKLFVHIRELCSFQNT